MAERDTDRNTRMEPLFERKIERLNGRIPGPECRLKSDFHVKRRFVEVLEIVLD
jgi:hypothetical protein